MKIKTIYRNKFSRPYVCVCTFDVWTKKIRRSIHAGTDANLPKKVKLYLDNVLVYDQNQQKNLEIGEEALEALWGDKMITNKANCEVFENR